MHSATPLLTVAVFTAARSDLGPLGPVIEALDAVPGVDLVVVATGAHLLENRGNTVTGINVAAAQLERIAVDLPDTDPRTIASAIGPIADGVSSVLARRGIDVFVVLGDRWELLAATSAALIAGIPIVHLHGGELTAGAIDDRIRHAVSKLSDLHCCATEDSARRLRQIGEADDRIVVTGAPGLDRHALVETPTDAELREILGVAIERPLGLVTFHPETVDRSDVAARARSVLEGAARRLGTMVVTYPGVDPGAEAVINTIADVAEEYPNVAIRPHLGRGFSSVLAGIDVMIGNSSSGLWEAASFELPVVDVGDRQAGRLRPGNVVHCSNDPDELSNAIDTALDPQFRASLHDLVNPYGDGRASARVVRAIVDLMHVPRPSKAFVDRWSALS